ncbi:anti-sigma factor antagonist [Mycolicibacterium poriferae]|uniref:anti-sigma factor antagonist n=1 Tax=Mycolicibacterium poriferae TaxID=39694 RepID=UPI0024BA54D4|nr:anti-sigma factor antagonist [Mycolicibacterium poriferae]
MGLLDITQDVSDSAVVVHARGEVDSGTVDLLGEALAAGLAAAGGPPARMLVLILDEVTYFGSAGLNAVLSCYEQGASDGVAVRVVATNAEVVRPIEVTKLDGLLRPYPTVTDALMSGSG